MLEVDMNFGYHLKIKNMELGIESQEFQTETMQYMKPSIITLVHILKH